VAALVEGQSATEGAESWQLVAPVVTGPGIAVDEYERPPALAMLLVFEDTVS
jgi:hypothetical protein